VAIDDSKQLFAIVLAAGAATRFGATKQLATIDGQPLAGRAARLAATICGERLVLVLGHDALNVHAAVQPHAGFVVVNERYREGIASSLARGIQALPESAAGVLVLLCDQPFVSVSDLERLEAAWRPDTQKIAACRYAGSAGVPAIFPRRLFARIGELSGDTGARSLIANELPAVTLVECPAAGKDIDRPEDLQGE
jgi:molybdenum cofactor cytidylyltransferase